MTDAQLVDCAVLAWHATIEALCRLLPEGAFDKGAHGTHAVTSGTPIASLNGVFSTMRQPDMTELSSFAASYSKSTLPWSIQVRSEGSNASVAQTAAEHGLTKSFEQPFMLKHLREGDAAMRMHGNASVRQVPKEEHQIYNQVLAAGCEAPEHVFHKVTAPEVLGARGMSAYLVEEAGIPVATSFGVLAGDYVGVFNIATPPAYRLRGYARMATAAVLRNAYAHGARTAFLHSTPDGYRVYESLGFATAETWRIFVRP
jgi:GNAT superfamily N-acetyltransferase